MALFDKARLLPLRARFAPFPDTTKLLTFSIGERPITRIEDPQIYFSISILPIPFWDALSCLM